MASPKFLFDANIQSRILYRSDFVYPTGSQQTDKVLLRAKAGMMYDLFLDVSWQNAYFWKRSHPDMIPTNVDPSIFFWNFQISISFECIYSNSSNISRKQIIPRHIMMTLPTTYWLYIYWIKPASVPAMAAKKLKKRRLWEYKPERSFYLNLNCWFFHRTHHEM